LRVGHSVLATHAGGVVTEGVRMNSESASVGSSHLLTVGTSHVGQAHVLAEFRASAVVSRHPELACGQQVVDVLVIRSVVPWLQRIGQLYE
jgi:hypothetical protein